MIRFTLVTLLPALARGGHDWASGDEAAALANAATLGLEGTFSKSYTHHATLLREHLLDGYDKGVPPQSTREGNYSKAGVDVGLQLRFFKVDSVLAADGRMSLKVWMRTTWTDERLAWDPDQWGGITQLQFMGASLPAGAEVTEIWLPDVQPYNGFTGIHNTLDPVLAMVQSDGSIFFSRPGMLDVMCKFSGLAAFPYDDLKCAIEFGGWGMSGGYQGLKLNGGGYQFSSQEATAGSSYQEYSIKKVECELQTYFYECCANEPWPIVTYKIYLKRASYYYSKLIVMPGMLLTVLSFAVFWIEPEACDALSYGITVVLAIELTKIVLVTVLPICGETVWVELFTEINAFFAIFALLESVLQTVIAYTHTDSFFPDWMGFVASWLLSLVWKGRKGQRGKQTSKEDSATEEARTTMAMRGAFKQETSVAAHLVKKLVSRETSKGFHDHARKSSDAADRARKPSSMGAEELPSLEKLAEVDKEKPPRYPGAPAAAQRANTDYDDMRKIVFFEHLFFEMDERAQGRVDLDICAKRMAFLAILHTGEQCRQLVEKADMSKDGVLTRVEFVELCIELLLTYPIELLQASNDNFLLAKTQDERRVQVYWREASERMDQFFGTLIPCAYILTMAVLFNMTMDDEYFTNPEADMFHGFGIVTINGWQKYRVERYVAVLRMCVPIFLGIAVFSASFVYARVRVVQRKKKAKEERRTSGPSLSMGDQRMLSSGV